MAFLCPSGLGRKRHTRGYASMIGRVPERHSYDFMAKLDLANLNNDQETLRIVLHNFTARADEELSVKQGQKVHELFREGDWAYVAADDKKMGFIPFTHCARLGNRRSETSRQNFGFNNTKSNNDSRNNNVPNGDRNASVETNSLEAESDLADESFLSADWSYDSESEVNFGEIASDNPAGESSDSVFLHNHFRLPGSQNNNSSHIEDNGKRAYHVSKATSRHSSDATSITTTAKDTADVASNDVRVVLYNYKSCTDDEVSVRKDDIVLVLDASENDWFLVETLDREQGYIPSYYLGQLADDAMDQLENNDSQSAILQDEDQSSTRSLDAKPTKYPSYENISAIQKPETNQNLTKHKSHSIGGRLNSYSKDRSKSRQTNKSLIVPKSNMFKMKSESNLITNKSRFGNSNAMDIYTDTPTASTNKRRSRGSSETTNSPRSDISYRQDESFRSNAAFGALDEMEFENDLEEFVTTVETALRPGSPPTYQAYKYERERQAYYDEYFFDEPNPALKPKPNDEIINVSEILKLRNTESRSKSRPSSAKKNSSGRDSKGRVFGRDLLSIRQIMANLPSTKIENGSMSDSNKVRGVLPMRESSSSEEAKKVPSKTWSRRSSSEKSDTSKHVFMDNQETDRKCDWSFGYPRKTKASENNNAHEGEEHSNDICKDADYDDGDDDTDWEDVEIVEIIDDDSMLDLLDNADRLIDSSDELLSRHKHRPRSRSNRHRERPLSREDSNKIKKPEHVENASCNGNEIIETRHRDGCDLKPHHNDHRSDSFGGSSHAKSEYTEKTDTEKEREVSERLDMLLLNTNNNHHEAETVDHSSNKETVNQHQKKEDMNEAMAKCSNYIQNYVLDNDVFSGSSGHVTDNDVDDTNGTIVDIDADTSSLIETNTECDNDSCVENNIISRDGDKAPSDTTENTNIRKAPILKIDYTDVHGITEFVVIYDYESDTKTGLSVKRGDILHIGLDGQDNKHWYWAYSPSRRKYGYVPRAYVTIALVTVL